MGEKRKHCGGISGCVVQCGCLDKSPRTLEALAQTPLLKLGEDSSGDLITAQDNRQDAFMVLVEGN